MRSNDSTFLIESEVITMININLILGLQTFELDKTICYDELVVAPSYSPSKIGLEKY